MVRDIKFRGWDGEKMYYNIHMLYDGYGGITDRDGNELDIYECKNCNVGSFADWLRDKEYKVMQFTGLKDKNGKEIYEGDIVECRHVVGNLYPIDGNYEYENVLEAVSWDKNEVRFTRGHSNWGGECEIVGNIYENPELLK